MCQGGNGINKYFFGSKTSNDYSISLHTFSGGPRVVSFDYAKNVGWGPGAYGLFNNPGGEVKIKCGNKKGSGEFGYELEDGTYVAPQ